MLKRLPYLLYAALIVIAIPLLANGQTITSFSPTAISAGTNSILTINGTGFGVGQSTSNYVQFRSADDGGVSYFSPISTDYMSWNNTQITLKVPSKATTGNFRVVINSIGVNSPSNLTITYNLLNTVGPDGNSVQSKKINRNGSGGYTFQFNTVFNANAEASASFTRALTSWRCATNINWSIGSPTTINADASDGVNVVKYGTASEIEVGTLAYCRTYSRRCGAGNWESVEIDFVVNNRDYTWNYSTNAPPGGSFDFESVALHELGHAHSLGHVNNNADVMHYAVSQASMKRTLNSFNIEAGLVAMSYAITAGSVCYPPMIPLAAGSCGTKANQIITAPGWQSRTFGDADFDHNITASSGLTVTITSSNPAVATIVGNKIHIVSAGSATITASQAGNNDFNAATSLNLSLVVNKASQTITFPVILTTAINAPDFDPLATASSGLAIGYNTSNPSVATIVGGKIHIVGLGSVTITASQSGNTNYNAATSVNRTFTVAGQSQTITFNALPNKLINDADFDISATASSGLPITYTSSNPAVAIIVGTKIHILAAGTTIITASQAGNGTYAPAQNVSQNLTISKLQQSITFNAFANKVYGDPDFEIGATASSGLTVTYISSDPSIATIIGTKIHILTAGTVNVTAVQAGNLTYDAAPNLVRSLTIAKAEQIISFPEIGFKNYNDPDFTVLAISNVGLPITYKSSIANIATVNGDKVHIHTEGTVLITAMQVGNINYNAAPEVSRELIIGYTLPASNFRIQSTDETCKTSNNGSISITAAQALSYTAVITGNTKTSTQNFSTSMQLTGLEAGVYTICITVAGSSSYKQCFETIIKEPKDLTVYSSINKDENSVVLKLEGSDFYTIELNGETTTTTQQEIVLPLIKGNNLVKISTNKTCQGIIEKSFITTNDILIYPNPVKDILNVNIGNLKAETVKVDIYSLDGRLVQTSNQRVEYGRITLTVSQLSKGLYILSLTTKNEKTIHKFIKE